MDALTKDPVWHDFFYLELTTGLRLGEICGLKWEDFDEKKGTLKIQRSIGRTVTGQNITVGDPKTEKGKRMIKLPDSTFQVLLRRKEKYKGDWMFPSIKYPGKPVAPSAAYHRHKQILKDLDLPSIRFHDLRHTFATHAIKVVSMQKHCRVFSVTRTHRSHLTPTLTSQTICNSEPRRSWVTLWKKYSERI